MDEEDEPSTKRPMDEVDESSTKRSRAPKRIAPGDAGRLDVHLSQLTESTFSPSQSSPIQTTEQLLMENSAYWNKCWGLLKEPTTKLPNGRDSF